MKHLLLSSLCGLLLLSACNKNLEVQITEQETHFDLSVNISPASLVSGLKNPVDNTPLFPNGAVDAAYRIRIKLLVYNSNGQAVVQEDLFPSTFQESVSYQKKVEEGTYTVIACLDIYSPTGAQLFWQYDGLNALSTARIYRDFNNSNTYIGINALMGMARQNILVTKAETIHLTLAHTGAMTSFYFTNSNPSYCRYIQYRYTPLASAYQLETGAVTQTDFYYAGEIDFTPDSETSYSGYLHMIDYLLPTSSLSMAYLHFDAAGNALGSTFTISNLTVTAGNHKTLTLDVINNTYSY